MNIRQERAFLDLREEVELLREETTLLRQQMKMISRTFNNTGCKHTWTVDGQTMLGIRWYCTKCGESKVA